MGDGGHYYPPPESRPGLGLLIAAVASVALWLAIVTGAIELWMLLD